jgi:phosphoglycolate phosphatase
MNDYFTNLLSTIDLIVWDWNGTIFDDARICQQITNGQLQKLGLKALSYEAHEILFCHPVEEYYRKMGVNFKDGQFEELSSDFHKTYSQLRTEGTVRGDAVLALKKFKEASKDQIVLSAYQEVDLISLVKGCELDHYFKAILGLPDCHAVSKVARGVDWIKEQGYSPENVLIIGDTNHDFAVANALGANCLLTPSGYQHRNLLLQTGAIIFDSLSLIVN